MKPKDIANLTESDFCVSPRWMFYGGHHGECYDPFVTVIPEQHPDFDPDSVCLVKTEYRFRDGSAHRGFIYTEEHNLAHTIFVGSEVVSTWRGIREPSKKELETIYVSISRRADEVFPVTFMAFDGGRNGILEGFYFIDPDQNVRSKK